MRERTLVGAFLLVFVGIGITINTVGLFIGEVTAARDFPTGPFALVFSIGALVNILGSILVGRLLERYDHRPVMTVSILLLGFGMALYAAGRELWHFYLVAFLTGSGTAGSHLIPATTFVTRMFRHRRGAAMAVVLAGNGLGGLVFNPLFRWIIETNPLGMPFGYQSGYLLAGGAIIAVLLPVTFLLPAQALRRELVPANPGGRQPVAQSTGLKVGAAVRTPAYWALAIMIAGVSSVFMGGNQHLYIHFNSVLGFSGSTASRLIGVMMGMTVPGALTAGLLIDRIGIRATLASFGYALVVLLFLVSRVELLVGAWAFVLFYGFFNVVQTVMPPLLVSDVFGSRHFSSIFGSLMVAQTIGAAAGPYVLGALYDSHGDYTVAFSLCAVLLAAGVSLGVFSRRGRVHGTVTLGG
jgi:MFS family permease